MSRRDDDEVEADELADYVPVVYAASADEAEWYRQLLEDHDVPALVDEEYGGPPPEGAPAGARRVPVLVPELMLEESKEFIAELDDMDDFVADDALDESDDEDEDDELGPGFDVIEDEEDL